MGKDHDRLDLIFLQFSKLKKADFSKSKSLFQEFNQGIQRHILWEEKILFPLFEEKTGMKGIGPTEVMRMEHSQIKFFLEKISTALSQNTVQDIDGLESGLLDVLKPHNEKEENVLYPAIDRLSSEIEREKALESMKKIQ